MAGHLIIFLLSARMLAQPLWTGDTAAIHPEGTSEVGVFSPYIHSFGTWEVSTYPIWDLLAPGITVKKQWYAKAGIAIASRHGLEYPTFLLKSMARNGAGGIIPPDSSIPHILSMENTLLVTWSVGSRTSISFKMEADTAGTFGASDFPTIDFALAYPRTAHYHTHFSVLAGSDIQIRLPSPAKWIKALELLVDIDVFYMPRYATNHMFEHKTALYVQFSTWALIAGYKLSWGPLPSGTDFRIFPIIDALWTF